MVVHPTKVDENETVRRKHVKAHPVRDKYTFAFSRSNYCDIEVYNILGRQTTSAKEFREGFKTLDTPGAKPVVFFICYDIGHREGIDTFIRHVVCCLARRTPTKIEVSMFDMRNLREIDNKLRAFLEQELAAETGVMTPIRVQNNACVERSACVYLQRYKPKTDIGWCIAWALFFLETAICRPIQNGQYAADLSLTKQKEAFAELYRVVDRQLRATKTNGFIEDWFASELEG